MIRYRLACDCGHEFESWFASGRAYDEIIACRGVQCPSCGGSRIGKAMMAPSIVTSADRSPIATSTQIELADPEKRTTLATAHDDLVRAARKLHQLVKEKSDYVGPRFADEARRIDSGEAPDRGIYGEATAQDALALIEDGIAVLPLPSLPEEHN